MRAAFCFASIAVFLGSTLLAAEKSPFSVVGTYVEGCSCSAPCTCSMTDLERGCQGVGGVAITSGNYQGTDLTGVKAAYATTPTQWVRIYIDAKNPAQEKAAGELLRRAYAVFGKVEAVTPAKIVIIGRGGHYRLLVNGGKTMRLTTKPVFGGDGITPITHGNVKDPLNTSFQQGKTVSGSYNDGERSFSLKGSNAYLNPGLSKSGRI